MANDNTPEVLQSTTRVGAQPPEDSTKAAIGRTVKSFFGTDEEPAKPSTTPVAAGYVPPILARRTKAPTLGEETPLSAPSFLSGVQHDIEDYGLAHNTARAIEDLTFTDERDGSQVIAKELPQLQEEFELPDQIMDSIMLQAKNADHARVLAERAQRVLKNNRQRDSMGAMQALTTGLVGFVADPTNLVPGLALYKGVNRTANMLNRLAPRLAAYEAKAGTKVAGKVASWSAFGAVEEGIRNSPRLANDPTYTYEQYLLEVGLGAGFGGGIAAGIPAVQWAKTGLRPLGKAIRSSWEKAYESASVRMGVNLAADAAKSTKDIYKEGLIKAVKEYDTAAAVRAARNKARQQADEAKTVNSINRAARAAADKVEKSGEEWLSFSESMKEILDAYAPPGSKLRSAVEGFNKWVDDKAAKKAADEQSVGAGKRTDTVKTKAEDVMHDVETELKRVKNTVKQQMDDITASKDAALKAIGDGTDAVSVKARAAIEATAKAAERAVEAAARRSGHKVVRKALQRDDVMEAVQKKFDTHVESIPRKLKNIGKLLKPLGLSYDKEMMRKINAVFADYGIDVGVKGPDANVWGKFTKLMDEGMEPSALREDLSKAFAEIYDDIHDMYMGHPADKNWLEAKRLIREQQDELESLVDWAGMLRDREYSDLTKLDPRWALLSDEYETAMGASRGELHKLYDKLAQKFISKQFGTLTESLSAKLVRTKVPLAEWMALNILELPAGTGGKVARNETAAILSMIMEAEHGVPVNKAWFTMMDEAAKEMGMGRFKRAILRTAGGNTHPVVQQINRDLMKHMNALQMGKQSSAPAYIVKFAKVLEDANEKLYSLQLNHNIEGITGHNKMKNYMKQHWNDGGILDLYNNPDVGRDTVVRLLGKSLKSRAGNRMTREDAMDLAEALLDTKIAALNKPRVDAHRLRSDNLAGSMASIEDIIAHLNMKGKQSAVESVLKWTAEQHSGGPGYVHKRFVNLDYTTTVRTRSGKEVSILDLLDNDVMGGFTRYNKEATGRSAISRASGGRLNSEQAINDFIGAVGMQAADMGTYVNTRDIRNVFRQMMGLPYDGQLPMDVRKIRDAVALAGMNGLGESQLAEFGLAANRGMAGLFAMNQLASKTVGRVKQWRGLQLTPEQQRNTKFLNELQEFSRLYEDMHIVARNNVHFDAREPSMATSAIQKLVDTGTGGKYRPTLQYLQTRWTGYGSVRTMEEQVAMAGLMHDAVKLVTGRKAFGTRARFADVGLDLDMITRKLKDGTIEVDGNGNIKTLNMHRWSKAEEQSLAVALRRHAGQQVQMGFAGEMSPFMMNPVGAFLMQFRTYPMLAAEKQMGRNFMFADKEAGMGIALNAASSSAARMLRYYSLAMALPEDKREQYLDYRFRNHFAHDTAQYMGIVGMMVNNYDTAMALGGNGSIGDQFPMINWADNYMKAVKSASPLDGYDERDIANMQRGAPLGTIMYVNALAGVIRNLMETDSDSYEARRNRGS